MPVISDIYFWVDRRCWGQTYVSRKHVSTPAWDTDDVDDRVFLKAEKEMRNEMQRFIVTF